MQLEEAVKDGFDVRGYMYWTLIDNYEWNFAFELKFGLYSYDDDEAKTRHKRKGAEVCNLSLPHQCLCPAQLTQTFLPFEWPICTALSAAVRVNFGVTSACGNEALCLMQMLQRQRLEFTGKSQNLVCQ